MAKWDIEVIDKSTTKIEKIDAHQIRVHESGALIFFNHNENCHLRIFASGKWLSVTRTEGNPAGFPYPG